MTERENERKRADARIEAERQASEERIRELMEENARLKAMVAEKEIASAGTATSTMQAPAVRKTRAKKLKARVQYRKPEPSAAVPKESLEKSSGGERNSAHADRASHLGEEAPEHSPESPESSEKETGYKPNLRFRKRPPTERLPVQKTRRSKRQMLGYDGPTEDSEFLFWRRPKRIDSHTHLEKFTGYGMDTHDDHSQNTWSQHAAEPYKFGPNHLAGPGAPGGGVYGGELPDQMGHPSTELALEDATRPQTGGKTTGHAELGVVPRPKKSRPALPRSRREAGGVQVDGGFAGNTEQEPKPEESVQQPAGPTKTTHESKLVENMEQVQGMVEKLSLLLQVGQHAIGEHEAGVTLTAQS